MYKLFFRQHTQTTVPRSWIGRHEARQPRFRGSAASRQPTAIAKYFAEVLSRKALPKAYRIDRILKLCNRARSSIRSDEGKTIS